MGQRGARWLHFLPEGAEIQLIAGCWPKAGDSIKRFYDSGVLELRDRLEPRAVAIRTDQKVR